MSILLDTHAFFWCVRAGAAVPGHVREALTSAPRRLVSDISAFEVALKVRLGTFPGARALQDQWQEAVRRIPALTLPVSTEHALLAGSLDWPHRDPFDRILAAQALIDGLTLLTADEAFTTVPGLSLLRW